jgi:hypothetical protein
MDGVVIYFGGMTFLAIVDQLDFYLLQQRIWVQGRSITQPSERFFSAMSSVDGGATWFLYGGFDGRQVLSDLWVLDTMQSPAQWYYVSDDLPVGPRAGMAMHAANGVHYLLCGTGSSRIFSDVWYVSPDLSQHQQIDSRLNPEPRYLFASAVLRQYGNRGAIVLHGGGLIASYGHVVASEVITVYDTTWLLDLETHQWANLSSQLTAGRHPGRRMFHSGTSTLFRGEECFFLMGGHGDTFHGSSYVDDMVADGLLDQAIYVLSLRDRAWHVLSPPSAAAWPSPRYAFNLASSATGDYHLLFGGSDHAYRGVGDYLFDALGDLWLLHFEQDIPRWRTLEASRGGNRSMYMAALVNSTFFVMSGQAGYALVTSSASSLDLACEPGWRQTGVFSGTACSHCPVGTFNPSVGSSSCQPCPAGTTTANEGIVLTCACVCVCVCVCAGGKGAAALCCAWVGWEVGRAVGCSAALRMQAPAATAAAPNVQRICAMGMGSAWWTRTRCCGHASAAFRGRARPAASTWPRGVPLSPRARWPPPSPWAWWR